MTEVEEFNEKYKNYLEEGHYGLAIHSPKVVAYLDDKFKELTSVPGFTFTQIKTKFGDVRFYAYQNGEGMDTTDIQKDILKILAE